MPKPAFWPQDEIHSLFSSAALGNEETVELPSAFEARHFAFACFNFRRAKAEFANIQVSNPGASRRVTLRRKRPAPALRRVLEEQQEQQA